ncbi:MAG: anti-sigma factor family protein [Terriglobales bacterium]
MNCKEIRELLPDLAAGMGAATPEPEREIEKHLASCASCAAHLDGLRKTMALLDEWQTPEPSPYFDTRFAARFREELARPPAGWLSWLHRPAWAMSLAAVLFVGALSIGVGIGGRSYISQLDTIATNPPSLGLPVAPGTAVGDLQALARNDELYADFDVLDELQVQDDVNANP